MGMLMSALDFDMVMNVGPIRKGDRVKITMSVKICLTSYYGAAATAGNMASSEAVGGLRLGY